MTRKLTLFLLLALGTPGVLRAESVTKAGCVTAALDNVAAAKYRAELPGVIVTFGNNPLIQSAKEELTDGILGMLGKRLRQESRLPGESAIVIESVRKISRGRESAEGENRRNGVSPMGSGGSFRKAVGSRKVRSGERAARDESAF